MRHRLVCCEFADGWNWGLEEQATRCPIQLRRPQVLQEGRSASRNLALRQNGRGYAFIQQVMRLV
jgi:hypothetical protein